MLPASSSISPPDGPFALIIDAAAGITKVNSKGKLLQVTHKNTQNINALKADISHLDTIITTLIKYNPALVYAKLMSQVDDVTDYLDSLLDTVQQLQHQKLSIKLLTFHQLHILFQSVLASANKNDWSL